MRILVLNADYPRFLAWLYRYLAFIMLLSIFDDVGFGTRACWG
jgi:hypothetical protein